MNRTTTPPAPNCPKCSGTDAIPYVFGYPRPELLQAVDPEKVILGGCVVWPGQPAFRCRACATEFTKQGREAVSFEERRRAHMHDSIPLQAREKANK
jgi:hypothetical protein